MSECEEECEDDAHHSQVREETRNIKSEDEDFGVVRIVTKYLGRYNNNNLIVNNDGFDNDENATTMEGEEFREEDLIKVLEE